MDVELKGQVYVGFCDIAQVGAQVLLKLCLGNELRPVPLELCGGDELTPFFKTIGSAEQEDLPAIVAFTAEEMSVVVVNAHVPSTSQANVIHSLIQTISARFPQKAKSLIVIGALRIRNQTATAGPYVLRLQEEQELPRWVKGLEVLPSSLPVEDGSISMAIHCARAMEVPLFGVFVQGFKPLVKQGNSTPEDHVDDLASILEKATNLKLHRTICLDAIRVEQPSVAGDSLMFI